MGVYLESFTRRTYRHIVNIYILPPLPGPDGSGYGVVEESAVVSARDNQ